MNQRISIVLLMYQHGQFLEEALESIVKQVVAVDYEVILADDGSRDETNRIIFKFSRKNPEIRVKICYHNKNMGAKRNILDAVKLCTGKYIAFLEGDDYWTDPHKLQKQIDFLEKNHEYSAVTHDCREIDMDGNLISEVAVRFAFDKKIYTQEDVVQFGSPGHASSMMIRNYGKELIQFLEYLTGLKYCPGDSSIPMFLLTKGNIYHEQEVMSVYRHYIIKDGTNWSSKHDLRKDYNYLFYFKIIREQERVAKYCGLQLDFFQQKRDYCACCIDGILNYKSKKQMVYFSYMLLLTPNRYRLFTTAIRAYRKQRKTIHVHEQ